MLKKIGTAGSDMTVELPPLNIHRMGVTLIGETPLIIHRWSEKAKKELLDKQMQKAKSKKQSRDPDEDFEQALYKLDLDGNLSDTAKLGECLYGFPVVAFKAAAVTACTSIGGITKVQARQAFHIDGEYAVIQGSEPRKREDMVRIGMGTADIRFRPEFMPWYTTLTISHNANVMSPEQILNMLNTAGFGVGIGEWRPEKDGTYGRFHVANEIEMGKLTEYQEKITHTPKKVLVKR